MSKVEKADMLNMYRLLKLTRMFETHMEDWYAKGLIQEPNHPSTGQEAINIGFCYPLRKGADKVVPTLRSRSAFFTMGVPLKTIMMIQGVKEGCLSGGHETSHHSAYPDQGVMGSSAMVGSSLCMGVGAAMAMKMRKEDNVVMIFQGDGGYCRGDFHEGINFASAFNLPCVFVIENNQIAATTQQSEYIREGADLAAHGKGYGIPGYTIDGNDVIQCYETALECIERARTGGGPSLINAVTVRMGPHQASPYAKNNIKPELLEYGKKTDAIERLAKQLKELGYATDESLAEIDAEIDKEIVDTFNEVKDLPRVSRESMLNNVYCD